MKDVSGFLLLLVALAIASGVAAFIVFQMNSHLTATYARVAAIFHGRYRPGSWHEFPALSFEYEGRTVIVDTVQLPKRKVHTRLRILWPDRDLRCEIYPHGIFDRLNALFGVTDIEIGSHHFDSTYVISGSNPAALRSLLTGAVQNQIQILRRFRSQDVYVAWEGGWLTVRKDEVYRSVEDLKRFIRLALDLFDAGFAARGEGIEFVGDVREGTVVSDPFALPTDHEAICRVCGEAISADGVVFCRQCRTPHHIDCWKYYGACSVYACGCKQVARPRKRPAR